MSISMNYYRPLVMSALALAKFGADTETQMGGPRTWGDTFLSNMMAVFGEVEVTTRAVQLLADPSQVDPHSPLDSGVTLLLIAEPTAKATPERLLLVVTAFTAALAEQSGMSAEDFILLIDPMYRAGETEVPDVVH